MGARKSDLVAALLAQPLESMRSVLLAFPDPIDRLTEADKERLYGQLGALVVEAIHDAAVLPSHG
jgi:hypothetical protein